MSSLIKVILNSGKEKSIRRLHPWIFSGAIKNIIGNPKEGDIVEVYSNKDEFLALGHYQVGSIAIRIFAFENIKPDIDFWYQKIYTAYQLRSSLYLTNNSHTDVYRLVNGEGDFLPGLIIDFYNGVAVMQIHSIGMYHIRELITEILKKIYGHHLLAVYDKSEQTIPHKSKINPRNEYLFGSIGNRKVKENDNLFMVDWEEGQKTGFFIDQRENRALLKTYAANKKVLNMFCYTGGFSVYALQGGASMVHSVDSSVKAIELTDSNIALNFADGSNHSSFVADALKFLNNPVESYDLIILDPPAFAKHQNVLDNALQGYKRLNMKAFELIAKNGIVFTFSCSQAVSKENFRKAVFAAAANTGRKIKILHQLSQPPDHPVSIYHPEGEYLKGLVLHVE